MFGKTIVTRVGLPKRMWEPLRRLNDEFDVRLETLAYAWNMSEREMLRVLYAARLAQLEEGDEGRWLEELGDGNADALSPSR